MSTYSNDPYNIQIPFTIKHADSFFTRLKGLMFRRKPLHDEGLWIVPCNSIHMFFMSFPIDVVFLDKEKQIVEVVENIQPWKLITPVNNAHSTLELPVGTIKKYGLGRGKKVEF